MVSNKKLLFFIDKFITIKCPKRIKLNDCTKEINFNKLSEIIHSNHENFKRIIDVYKLDNDNSNDKDIDVHYYLIII